MLNAKQLQDVVGCKPATAEKFVQPLGAAMMEYGIASRQRAAAFLAQIGHESGSFQWLAELWGPTAQQRRYERDFTQPWPSSPEEARQEEYAANRLAYTLGNSEQDDGFTFRGHGLIQVTGRTNHANARNRLRVPDFVAQPQELSVPEWAAYSAGDFWHAHGLNELADKGDIVAITRKINGGTNGLQDRQARYERAMQVLA